MDFGIQFVSVVMGIIHNTVRKLFAKKQAPEPSEIEALRHDLRKQYHSFRLLLNANNRALEIMAELEQALKGEHPFGMTFMRSRCTAIAVNVFQLIDVLLDLFEYRVQIPVLVGCEMF